LFACPTKIYKRKRLAKYWNSNGATTVKNNN
jgi:hypothetical protein